jgi:nucleotide-binding universal stress UspA family protein
MQHTALDKGSRTAPDAPVRIKKILVPFDFSEPATRALDFAQRLAPVFGASVEALYVVAHPPAVSLLEMGAIPMDAGPIDEIVADAEARLDEALAPAGKRHRYLDAEARLDEALADEHARRRYLRKTVRVGDPRAQILALAAAEDVDLIVMGTHGRTGAAHFWLGSVAERVVREANRPVLTVH